MLHGDISGRQGGGETGPETTLPTGYTHRWLFDEGTGTTLTDSEGTLNATLINGPAWLAGARFENDEAVDFTATSSQYATAGNNANFTGEFTIYAQVELDSVSAFNGNVVSKGRTNTGGSLNDQYWLGIDANGAWRFSVANSAGSAASAGISTYTMQTGAVVDLIGRLGTDGVVLFVNGTKQSTNNMVTSTSTLNQTQWELSFARDGHRNAMFLDGKMGHVALWPRALTDTEVASIDTATAPAPEPDPVWDLNADFETATTPSDVYDEIGQSTNQTISTTVARSGSKSLRHAVPTGSHYGAHDYWNFPTNGFGTMGLDPGQPDAVTTQFSLYMPSNFSQPAGDTCKLYVSGMNASAGPNYGGGGTPTGDDGWSVRLASKGNTTAGQTQVGNYTYHMDQARIYGEEEYFTTLQYGQWYDFETYVKLNSVNADGTANYDGISRVWINGTLSYDRTNLRWRTTTDQGFDRLGPQTYWGGDMTSPQNNYFYYDDQRIRVEEV